MTGVEGGSSESEFDNALLEHPKGCQKTQAKIT